MQQLALLLLSAPLGELLGGVGRRLDGFGAGDECDLHVGDWANSVPADTSSGEAAPAADTSGRFWTGVILSIVADAAIAVSLNIQKLAHNRNQGPDGKPRVLYLKLPLWWAGMLTNIAGEVGNMLAYGFAPAAVVAPVGSVGVFFNEIIAVLFLKEAFRKRDAVGLLGIVGGVVLIIMGVPQNGGQLTAHAMMSADFFGSPRAYGYIIFLCLVVAVLIGVVEPRYAQKNIMVWLTLCSVISSVTVVASRGFSSMLTTAPADCALPSFIHGKSHAPCMQTVAHLRQ